MTALVSDYYIIHALTIHYFRPWYSPQRFSVQKANEGGNLYTIASLHEVLHVGAEHEPVGKK